MLAVASARRTSRGWQYAEPPRFTPDVTYSLPVGGQSHNPNTSAELNTLLTGGTLDGKTLARGDVITLDAGTTYTPTGNTFTIPALSGSGWVYVISSALGSLPAAGVRVSPSNASNMPKILAKSSAEGYPAIAVTTGSKYFRFVGIEVAASASNFTYSLCDLGAGTSVEASLPEYIYFDRCYIHGDSTLGARSGINMAGKYMAAINCYISGFQDAGAVGDTQAIRIGDGIGGHLIQNNYLEGGGENFISGGNDPSNLAWVAADVTIRGNHFYKPLAWRNAGLTIKNHLELKWAKRFLIERNFFENYWEEDQDRSFNIAEINQSGSHTAAIVEDITLRWNKWNKTTSWLTTCFSTCGNAYNTAHGGRILVHDNLVTNMNAELYAGYAQPVAIGTLPRAIYVYHNTCIFAGSVAANSAVSASGLPGTGVHVENNIFWSGTYGLKGDAGLSFETYWDDWTVAGNVLVGGSSAGSGYESGTNYYPANEAAIGFVGSGDYTLSGGSSYKNAGTDGRDIGCTNVTLVESYATAATNGTAS